MQNINGEIKTIGKREVNNLFKKLSTNLVNFKTAEEIKEYIFEIIPDVKELGVEEDKLESGVEIIDFIIPRKYSGKHTNAEYRKMNEDFGSLIDMGSVYCDIYKKRDEIEINIYAWVEFYDNYKCKEGASLLLNQGSIAIPLSIREVEVKSLINDINQLSSETMATFISEEKIGEASSNYLLIDEIRNRFLTYTKEYIESTLKVPSDWKTAWNIFKDEVSIKDIAYGLGIEKDNIELYGNILKECETRLKDLKTELKDILKQDKLNLKDLSEENLRLLTYAYSLKILKNHCEKCNESAIKKVKNETIPKVLNGSCEENFYLKYSEEGFLFLKKL